MLTNRCLLEGHSSGKYVVVSVPGEFLPHRPGPFALLEVFPHIWHQMTPVRHDSGLTCWIRLVGMLPGTAVTF